MQPRETKPSPAALDTIVHIQMREGEEIECPINVELLQVGEWAGRMPCAHWFDSDSLLKWLESHNSCPVCRYEIPTEDEEYNAEKNLTLETCETDAQAANKNPEDLYCKRLAQGVEDAKLEEIADAASVDVMEMQRELGGVERKGTEGGLLGKRGAVNISPSEHGSPQMTQQPRPSWGGSWGEGWSDTMCDKVLEEVLAGEGVKAAPPPCNMADLPAQSLASSCSSS